MNNCRPAIILAETRTGGTMLSSCLSNHPDIFCVRGEPLLDGEAWRESLPGMTDAQILLCIFTQFAYKIGMCKVTYDQFKPVQHIIRAMRVKIIHLVRGNVIRCCLSQLATGTPGMRAHSTREMNDAAIAVNGVQFIQRCRWHVEGVEVMQAWIDDSGLESITVKYEEMVGGEGRSVDRMEGKVSNEICGFLGVDYPVVLKTHLRKVNPGRIRGMVLEWNKLRVALAATEFAEMI